MEFNATITNLLSTRSRLDAATIKAHLLTKEEVKAYNEQLKALKAQDKLEAIKLEKCIIEYKGKTMNFKPSIVTTDNGTDIVIWKSLDKNAIYFAFKGEDGNLDYDAVANVSEKSQYFVLRKKLVSNNRKTLNPLLVEVFANMEWDAFFNKVKGYKNIKTINCPSVLKNL